MAIAAACLVVGIEDSSKRVVRHSSAADHIAAVARIVIVGRTAVVDRTVIAARTVAVDYILLVADRTVAAVDSPVEEMRSVAVEFEDLVGRSLQTMVAALGSRLGMEARHPMRRQMRPGLIWRICS